MAAESGLADTVRTIKNVATAQVRKDTPSLTDVKGLERPIFTGREEHFQQWSKTEAFFFWRDQGVCDDVGVGR